jgi:hypothetical protein
MVGAILVHEFTTSIHILTILTMGKTLEKDTTFLLIIFYVLGHGAYTQMSFCIGTPKLGISKFPKFGLLRLWKPITFCANLQLR